MMFRFRFDGAKSVRWLGTLGLIAALSAPLTAGDWLQFRGPNAAGYAADESVPTGSRRQSLGMSISRRGPPAHWLSMVESS
ncbi:MAG: hypothetical protein R3B96_21470 [Pirellulaceae bacterium]